MLSRGLRRNVLGLIAIIGSILFAGAIDIQAQTPKYPTRTITIINPWAAGNSNDLASRAIAPKLSKLFGVPVDVVSKPGGSGIIGSYEFVRSAPDGYTILAEAPGSSSMQIAMAKQMELPYKVDERTFLARAVIVPYGIFVNPRTGWKTLKDVEQAIRQNPDNIRVASCGSGYPELPMGQFKAVLSSRSIDYSKIKLVPFQGVGQVFPAMAGGHVDMYAGSISSAESLMRAGKLRCIAATSDKRCKFYPDIPTASEQGFPNISAEFWVGYSAPMGLPKSIIQTWVSALKSILNDPAMVETFDKLSLLPGFLAEDDFRKFILEEAKAIKLVMVPEGNK